MSAETPAVTAQIRNGMGQQKKPLLQKDAAFKQVVSEGPVAATQQVSYLLGVSRVFLGQGYALQLACSRLATWAGRQAEAVPVVGSPVLLSVHEMACSCHHCCTVWIVNLAVHLPDIAVRCINIYTTEQSLSRS